MTFTSSGESALDFEQGSLAVSAKEPAPLYASQKVDNFLVGVNTIDNNMKRGLATLRASPGVTRFLTNGQERRFYVCK